MMSRLVNALMGCVVVGMGIVGCSGAEESDASLASVGQAVVGVDEFLYFRCNATGWDVNDATRVTDPDDDGLFTIEYDVTQDWMVTGGDQCALTLTNQYNGWGSVNSTYGAATPDVKVPPTTWNIGAVNSNQAMIRYPELGRYRATVDWLAGTVSIEQVSDTPDPPEEDEYYYLRCNATGWNVGPNNRLVDSGTTLDLTLNVWWPWMVNNGDQCIVTQTNELDGWGTEQAFLGTESPTLLEVPVGNYATTTVVPAGQYFTVRYPSVGSYEAKFDPATGELQIGTFPAP